MYRSSERRFLANVPLEKTAYLTETEEVPPGNCTPTKNQRRLNGFSSGPIHTVVDLDVQIVQYTPYLHGEFRTLEVGTHLFVFQKCAVTDYWIARFVRLHALSPSIRSIDTSFIQARSSNPPPKPKSTDRSRIGCWISVAPVGQSLSGQGTRRIFA